MREPMTTPWSIGRPVILLVLAFVVGTGLGWAATRPFAGNTSQQITNVDYVAVVAQLFQREHNEEIARERLALLGSPTILVEQALREAQAGKVQDESDRAALQALAQALAPASASSSQPANVDAATQPASQPTVTTDDSAAKSGPLGDPEQSPLLGPIVAFVIAFLLGIVVLVRTAGLSLPLAGALGGRLSGARAPERMTRSRPPLATLRTGAPAFRPARPAGNGRRAEAAVVDAREDEPGEDDVPVRAGGRSATLVQPRTVARAARSVSFQSTYHLGDEPYDEIHPITDPSTGTLVAACGLSSALKLASSTAPRYYAFTAWVQDYLSDEQLRAVGLVTRGALDAESVQIDAWAREGQLEQVISAREGSSTQLKTPTITTEISVVEVDCGRSGATDGYFSKLTVRFDVHWDADEDL